MISTFRLLKLRYSSSKTIKCTQATHFQQLKEQHRQNKESENLAHKISTQNALKRTKKKEKHANTEVTAQKASPK